MTPEVSRTDLEITVLRGLISRAVGSDSPCAAGDASALRKLLDGPIGYVWIDEEHRVVYECLRSAHRHRRAGLREEMSAEATRMGHPDVDWDVYLRAPAENGADLPELIRRLKNNP